MAYIDSYGLGGGAHTGAGKDCCTVCPDYYKEIGSIVGGRLVEMKVPAGKTDIPHDHPGHSLFIVKGSKVRLLPPPGSILEKPETDPDTPAAEVDLPTGAGIQIPKGPHQVTNLGDDLFHCIFLEPMLICPPTGDIEGVDQANPFVYPMQVQGDCYNKVDENEDWMTVTATLEPGQTDAPHCHRDHIVYVLEGDNISIFPGKVADPSKFLQLDVGPGAVLPVPSGWHSVKNSGKGTFKFVYFEKKK